MSTSRRRLDRPGDLVVVRNSFAGKAVLGVIENHTPPYPPSSYLQVRFVWIPSVGTNEDAIKRCIGARGTFRSGHDIGFGYEFQDASRDSSDTAPMNQSDPFLGAVQS